jgi:transcriptional regulator with XRE-family HTH domain
MSRPHLCGECGLPMSETTGKVPYPESGLSNVELTNVPVWRCTNRHQDVQIPAIDELHLVLAKAIVAQPWGIHGNEVRFLRKFLGYSARAFSHAIGMHHVTLSNFETGRDPIQRDVEYLIRLFFAQALQEKYHTKFPKPLLPVLEALEQGTSQGSLELERVENDPDRLAEPTGYWQETSRP